jgi:hypothetical protein
VLLAGNSVEDSRKLASGAAPGDRIGDRKWEERRKPGGPQAEPQRKLGYTVSQPKESCPRKRVGSRPGETSAVSKGYLGPLRGGSRRLPEPRQGNLVEIRQVGQRNHPETGVTVSGEKGASREVRRPGPVRAGDPVSQPSVLVPREGLRVG